MKHYLLTRSTILVTALTFNVACGELLNQTLNKGLSQASDVMGKEIGTRMGKVVTDQVVRYYTPMLMQFYVSYLFNLGFGAGGYVVSEQAYEVGEWTRWGITGADEPYNEGGGWLERAFLGRDGEGNEWWRLKFYDTAEKKTAVIEALFDAQRQKILRMRAQFPKDEAPKEMPVDEHTYYIPPRKLTSQSLAGATVGTEQVSVPAGTFKAKHLRYGDVSNLLWDWWLSDSVPGGLIKYTASSTKKKEAQPEGSEDMDRDNYTLVLLSSGKDAKSELGVMP